MVNADASGARQPVYSTAQLTVNVGAANANKLGTLFYYNVDNQILEYMGQSDTDADGNVSFSFVHACDYVIVVDERHSIQRRRQPPGL